MEHLCLPPHKTSMHVPNSEAPLCDGWAYIVHITLPVYLLCL